MPLNAEGLITFEKEVELLPYKPSILPVCSAIYMIVNIYNDKYYIGSAVDVRNRITYHLSRLNRNLHHNQHLQGAWNLYGKDAFIYLILEKCSKEQLEFKEQLWMDRLKANDPEQGYNIRKQANSNQGHKWSEASKLNMANLKKGKPRSEETKEKLRKANLGKTGRKNTLETKIKMSEAAKLRWQKYHASK